MKYRDELIKSMDWLGNHDNVVFTGQAIELSGHAISGTVSNIDKAKRIELPVFEETQMGMAIGLALDGFVPVTCYPRFDFFILSLNQLVNHLDKIREMSDNEMKPKVIIRVAVGSKKPFSAGPQHTQDHTDALKLMLTDVEVIKLNEPEEIFPAFKHAYEREDGKSSLIIEYAEYYGTK